VIERLNYLRWMLINNADDYWLEPPYADRVLDPVSVGFIRTELLKDVPLASGNADRVWNPVSVIFALNTVK
jgi:hypothetical protein